MVASAADVVAFWQKAGPDRWFKKDPAFDDEIRERFLATHEAAAAGQLSGWEQSAEGALALLILLDQFPRNMFRSDARAFATDALARAITAGAIVRGFDSQVPAVRTLSPSQCRSRSQHNTGRAGLSRHRRFCRLIFPTPRLSLLWA